MGELYCSCIPGLVLHTLRPNSFTPPGWNTVTPRIVVREPERFVTFLQHVFAATGSFERFKPSVLRIGDSLIMVSEAGPRQVAPAFLYVYVADIDAAYRRALEAGALSLEAPSDLPYGDRRCMLEDPWGNLWQIATHVSQSSPA